LINLPALYFTGT